MNPLPRRTPHLALYREIKAAHRIGRIWTLDRVYARPVTSR